MTDRYTELFAEGVEQYDAADEAWNDVKEARAKVQWDPEEVRVESSSTTEAEFRFQTSASDD